MRPLALTLPRWKKPGSCCSMPARQRARRYVRHRCRVVPRHQCLRWPRLPCLWARLPCLRQRHAGRDRSRVRGERRVGGQLLRVRRHHRGEVEHGRPPPLGSHEGHRGGDAGVHSRCLAGSFSCEDLRRPRIYLRGSRQSGDRAAGHEEHKSIGGRPFRPGIIYLCCPELAPRSSFECNEIHNVSMKIRYFI